MSASVINFAKDQESVARCHEAMKGLWPELSHDDFVRRVTQQLAEGYQLVFLEEDGEVKSVIGFRISNILSRGKTVYIEDFSTIPTEQSRGFGDELFDWVCQHAISQGCEWMNLDCRVQNFKGHRFYVKKGMDITSHHFGMALKKEKNLSL
ncbi:MAG: GNAT family N-acetyltransferase [bacterium]